MYVNLQNKITQPTINKLNKLLQSYHHILNNMDTSFIIGEKVIVGFVVLLDYSIYCFNPNILTHHMQKDVIWCKDLNSKITKSYDMYHGLYIC